MLSSAIHLMGVWTERQIASNSCRPIPSLDKTIKTSQVEVRVGTNESSQPWFLCRRISCRRGKGGQLRHSQKSGPGSRSSAGCCVRLGSCEPCSVLPGSTCPRTQTYRQDVLLVRSSWFICVWLLQRIKTSSCTHFSDLHTPVEQALGVQAVLVMPDVFQ